MERQMREGPAKLLSIADDLEHGSYPEQYGLELRRAAEIWESLTDEIADLEEVIRQQDERISKLANAVDGLSLFYRAMKSMAAQFVHPKMTAEQLARNQLGEVSDA